MGKGRKSNKSSSKQNAVDVVAGIQSHQSQELQKRNVVQEEGSDSDEEKTEKGPAAKADLHGSDSEEDNVAAGRNMAALEPTSELARQPSKPLSNLSAKRKDRAPLDSLNAGLTQPCPSLSFQQPVRVAPVSAAVNTSPSVSAVGPSDDNHLSNEHLGRIIVRLLPSEYQVEPLPDGRYAMTPAAIGYLAQRLGH